MLRVDRMAVVLGLVMAGVPAAGQSFTLVGLPAGYTGGASAGVSADGSVVAGWSVNFNGYGPGWTWASGARTDLTGGAFPPSSGAYGISGDGRYVVGTNGPTATSLPRTAYRYDRQTGVLDQLGVLSPYTRSVANDASFDGAIVVGTLNLDSSEQFQQAFRWTPSGGMQPLGFTRPEHFISQAAAVSADGETVVGRSVAFDSDAFRWSSTTGLVALPHLPGTGFVAGSALGLTPDAAIIVGWAARGSVQRRPVLWSDAGIVDLGLPAGFARGLANAISADGSVIVGQIESGANIQAAIWTPQTGPMVLREYLAGIGLQLPPGLTLYNATGISADGTTIVGYTTGSSGEGFVLTIPAPACLAVLSLVPALLFRRRSRS